MLYTLNISQICQLYLNEAGKSNKKTNNSIQKWAKDRSSRDVQRVPQATRTRKVTCRPAPQEAASPSSWAPPWAFCVKVGHQVLRIELRNLRNSSRFPCCVCTCSRTLGVLLSVASRLSPCTGCPGGNPTPDQPEETRARPTFSEATRGPKVRAYGFAVLLEG